MEVALYQGSKKNVPLLPLLPARRDYLRVTKQRKPHAKVVHKAIGKQLGYLRRNLGTIDFLLKCDGHGNLSARQSKELETIRMLYVSRTDVPDKDTPDR